MAHDFPQQGGFTEQGLVELDAALERHVSPGEVPGLVALVARADGPRNGQVHVTVAGSATLGDPGTAGDLGSPLRRDSIFRIASMSKPVTGVAAMLLIEDGAMALDDPVERWLPELGARRVLRALDSPLDDTVPAARPVTVEDVLSFRLGFGCIMTPGSYPIADAEASLGLKTLGPPWPPGRHTSDEWIAALSGLPLMDQPGQRWRYNTGATVAGILIERVTGLPLPQVLAKRVFEPLGMIDTGFYVPAAKLGRFASMYAPPGYLGSAREGLELFDAAEGWYATPPLLPDGAAGLVSTIDDFWAFTAMLAGGLPGQPASTSGGAGLLSPQSRWLMLRDRTTDRDKAENPWFFGPHAATGWGLMMSVPAEGARTAAADGLPRGYGWDGGSGTTWRTDPATGLTGILLTQRMMTSPEPPEVFRDFWTAAYAALA
ncbi:MAG TPA: serine hydrolase domain-containing protein [Trebonia sp.]|nr:serine hydrolase domain-containing protein [Trebonia sp.]